MNTTILKYENWHIECQPDDGARISVLRYAGYDLLTTAPVNFRAPATDFGEYEKRPVYGYDDCFPSVSACIHPTGKYKIRDHGLLCWLKWKVKTSVNSMICTTECDEPKVRFTRTLELTREAINWKFDISNHSDKSLEFLLVVHPLMPLHEITDVSVPGFKSISIRGDSGDVPAKNPSDLNRYLLKVDKGGYKMLYLLGVNAGRIKLGFRNGMNLVMEYDHSLFHALGIWWNNSGYPDEEGIRRSECAFEPVPGINSNLEETYKSGQYLCTGPDTSFEWNIIWRILK